METFNIQELIENIIYYIAEYNSYIIGAIILIGLMIPIAIVLIDSVPGQKRKKKKRKTETNIKPGTDHTDDYISAAWDEVSKHW